MDSLALDAMFDTAEAEERELLDNYYEGLNETME